jgi:ABC-type antimicrobial peptide transport system permease subunit
MVTPGSAGAAVVNESWVKEFSPDRDALRLTYEDKNVLDAFAVLFFVFGVGALFLTMIGVRVALGASRGEIISLVLRQGIKLVGTGTAVGLVIAFGLSHVLASVTQVFQPAGALTYVAIAGALACTAATGLLRPVRHALSLEPMVALRRE